jgi:uncharacterized membrane protein YfcA
MEYHEIALLLVGGFVAGVINTMAGGGSLITVPMLVALGLPGTIANGTNRIGVLLQSMVGALRFRAEGVSGFRDSIPVLMPLVGGSLVGALLVSRLSDGTFERMFGIVMLVLLVPVLRSTASAQSADSQSPAEPWGAATSTAVFFAIGLYGGAIQAGVGILLVLALARSGFDLVKANSIKLVVVAAFTAVAVFVFVFEGQVVWVPALLLAVATSLGATVGARVAVRGGERIIRPVLVVSVLALAGRMLGLY